jgi:hypothetical protein
MARRSNTAQIPRTEIAGIAGIEVHGKRPLGCISVPVDLSGAEMLCVNQLPTEMEAVCLREPSFLAG